MAIDKLFDLLDDWRFLPAYQLERRADIFFALHLEKIIEKKFNIKIDTIIPEFPVRVGEIYNNLSEINKSFKIDYLTYSGFSNKVFLIELKTDLKSRRDNQDKYLQGAVRIKLNGLLNGVLEIYKATQHRTKYNYLLDKLVLINWLKRDNNTIKISCPDIVPEIIYIQPLNPDNLNNVVSFDDIIEILSSSNDTLTKRFIESLERWKTDPNKR